MTPLAQLGKCRLRRPLYLACEGPIGIGHILRYIVYSTDFPGDDHDGMLYMYSKTNRNLGKVFFFNRIRFSCVFLPALVLLSGSTYAHIFLDFPFLGHAYSCLWIQVHCNFSFSGAVRNRRRRRRIQDVDMNNLHCVGIIAGQSLFWADRPVVLSRPGSA